jgi:DNA primase large subunit
MRSGLGRDRESMKRERHEIISMYTEPPTDETTLDEFELFALDRLMVLRKIEDLKARNMWGLEMKEKLNAALSKYMRLNALSENFQEDVRKDVVSHFILRLAYCRTEDLRRWFIMHECALFAHRLDTLSPASLASFISANGLSFQVVSGEEKSARRARLLTIPNTPLSEFERSVYYKIPFAQATDLISSRSVYVEAGFAYVPLQRVVAIVVGRFRMGLSRSLTEAAAAFANVAGDPRFGPLLQNMSKQYVGRDYSGTGSGDGIRPSELDGLAQRSMPLCMRGLHSALNREHKLKHQGRLQYGLFLKGAGLNMEDALTFWQTQFTKVNQLTNYTTLLSCCSVQ